MRDPARWIVVLSAAALFFVGLGRPTYGVADVTRYAQMVLEMRHGQTLIPTLDGRAYYEAAPLAAWGPYFVARIAGGLTPAAVRLVSALAAFLSVLLCLAVASRQSLRAGVIAGAAQTLNVLSVVYGRGSRVDPVLGLAVAGAILAFARGARSSSASRRLAFHALSGGAMALAIAAKGPYAAALIAAALGPWLVLERRWRALWQGGVVALLCALLLTAAWLLPYLSYLGPDESAAFLRQLLGSETVAKFAGHYGKLAPPWTYAIEMPLKLAPWSLLALVALVRIGRAPRRASDLERLCACWSIFPLLLLSMSAGKHIRYLIPLVPAFSILAALELDRWLATASDLLRIRLAAVGAALGGLAIAAGIALPTLGVLRWELTGSAAAYAWISGLACVVGGLLAVASGRRGDLPASWLGIHVSLAAACVLVYSSLLALPGATAYERLAEALAPELRTDDRRITLVEPDDPACRIDASQLALYLGDRWVETGGRDDFAGSRLLLSEESIEGFRERAEVVWSRDRDDAPERWYLLERSSASARSDELAPG